MEGDETWIHHYNPEFKKKKKSGKSALIKARNPKKHEKKVMANFFYNFKVVFLLDYFPRNTTLNSEYYCKILEQLTYSIRNRRRGSLTKWFVFPAG